MYPTCPRPGGGLWHGKLSVVSARGDGSLHTGNVVAVVSAIATRKRNPGLDRPARRETLFGPVTTAAACKGAGYGFVVAEGPPSLYGGDLKPVRRHYIGLHKIGIGHCAYNEGYLVKAAKTGRRA